MGSKWSMIGMYAIGATNRKKFAQNGVFETHQMPSAYYSAISSSSSSSSFCSVFYLCLHVNKGNQTVLYSFCIATYPIPHRTSNFAGQSCGGNRNSYYEKKMKTTNTFTGKNSERKKKWKNGTHAKKIELRILGCFHFFYSQLCYYSFFRFDVYFASLRLFSFFNILHKNEEWTLWVIANDYRTLDQKTFAEFIICHSKLNKREKEKLRDDFCVNTYIHTLHRQNGDSQMFILTTTKIL